MARPTKYTPAVAKRITDAIKVGATYDLACSYGGIAFETFCQWRKKYPEFSDAIKESEGGAAVKWLALIDKAASDGTWQAAAWKLERRYPESYGRQVIDQRTSTTVGDLSKMPIEDLEALAKKRGLL